MAREKITEEFQTKFDKPHFQIGSAVFFSWLGTKNYGYVTAIKKAGWGIQYMVKSTSGTSYPCGLYYKGITTSYKVGIIYLEETKKLGNDVIAGRIAEREKILEFLKTPEGQRLQSQYKIQEAERAMMTLTSQLQTNPDLTMGHCMMINLAIHECSNVIRDQEKILKQI